MQQIDLLPLLRGRDAVSYRVGSDDVSAEDSFGERASVGVEVEGEVLGRDGESARSGDTGFAAVDVGRSEWYERRGDGELDRFGGCRYAWSPLAIQGRNDGSRDSVIESSTVVREDERVVLGITRSGRVEEEEQRSRKVGVESTEERVRRRSALFFEDVGSVDGLLELQRCVSSVSDEQRWNSRETNLNRKS